MTTTTLAHALTASDQVITLDDDADLVEEQILALDSEYCRVLVVLTPTQAKVQRGVNGTPSSTHEAGVEVTVGVPDDFLTGPQMVPVFGDADNVLTANGPSDAASFQLGGGSGGDVNLTGINGDTPDVGNGTAGVGTLRVAISSDNTAIPVTTDGLTDAQLRATPVPVSGTVTTGGLTDTQLRASPVPVSLTSTTVTGNVTVVQPTGTNLHAVIDSGTITTGGLTDTQLRATPVPVSGTVTASGPLTDTQLRATPVPVSGTVTVTSTTITGNVATTVADGANVNQGANADAAVAAGAAGTLSAKLRSISRDLVANIVLAAGTNLIGKVGIDQTTPGTTNAIAGDVASGSSDSSNPVKIGGKAVSAAPTAVSANQRTNIIADLWGRLYARTQAPTASTWTKSHLPATATQATATQASAGAGKRNRCTGFTITYAAGASPITAANPISVSLIDGASGVTTYLWRSYINVPAVAGAQVSIVRTGIGNMIGSQATAMTLEFSAAGGTNSYESVTMEGDIIEE